MTRKVADLWTSLFLKNRKLGTQNTLLNMFINLIEVWSCTRILQVGDNIYSKFVTTSSLCHLWKSTHVFFPIRHFSQVQTTVVFLLPVKLMPFFNGLTGIYFSLNVFLCFYSFLFQNHPTWSWLRQNVSCGTVREYSRQKPQKKKWFFWIHSLKMTLTS